MSCNRVVIFYENHIEKHTAKIINKLTPLLKKSGIKAYCFEIASDKYKQDLLNTYTTSIKFLANCAQTESIFNDCGETFIPKDQLQDAYTYQQPLTMHNLLIHTKAYSNAFLQLAQETKLLLKQTDAPDLHFCAMDMPEQDKKAIESGATLIESYKKRDHYMASKIVDQCESKGDVLALVGVSHFSIATLLRKRSIDVKEYYVIARSPYKNVKDNIGDLCLHDSNPSQYKECEGYQNQVLKIPLYDNSNINPLEIIGNDLRLFE